MHCPRVLALLLTLLAAVLSAEPGQAVAQDDEQAKDGQATAAKRWVPDPDAKWDYRLIEPPESVPAGVTVIFMDVFDTPARTVARFKRQGVHSICYINAGAYEDWRSDAKSFPKAVLGKDYEGWAGEKWLDIRKISQLAPIMRKRLDLCKEKGFAAVDPDNMNGYQNKTGFPLTAKDQEKYNIWFSKEARKRGLSVGLKNMPALARKLQPYFDFTVIESCVSQDWCKMTQPFKRAGKAIFAVEYTEEKMTLNKVCAAAETHGMTAILKHLKLNAWRRAC